MVMALRRKLKIIDKKIFSRLNNEFRGIYLSDLSCFLISFLYSLLATDVFILFDELPLASMVKFLFVNETSFDCSFEFSSR